MYDLFPNLRNKADQFIIFPVLRFQKSVGLPQQLSTVMRIALNTIRYVSMEDRAQLQELVIDDLHPRGQMSPDIL